VAALSAKKLSAMTMCAEPGCLAGELALTGLRCARSASLSTITAKADPGGVRQQTKSMPV
jgi:hypothetical protein